MKAKMKCRNPVQNACKEQQEQTVPRTTNWQRQKSAKQKNSDSFMSGTENHTLGTSALLMHTKLKKKKCKLKVPSASCQEKPISKLGTCSKIPKENRCDDKDSEGESEARHIT